MKKEININEYICRCAQVALLERIPASLRAVSASSFGKKVTLRCIFDDEPGATERQLILEAMRKFEFDMLDNYECELEIVATPAPRKMLHLKNLIYWRYEAW
jgi:hypothetical protein